VSKSGEQPYIEFNSFYENRLPVTVRVRDPHQDLTGRVAFFREPRTARTDLPQPPTCSLNLLLPSIDDSTTATAHDAEKIHDDDETESRSCVQLIISFKCVFSMVWRVNSVGRAINRSRVQVLAALLSCNYTVRQWLCVQCTVRWTAVLLNLSWFPVSDHIKNMEHMVDGKFIAVYVCYKLS